MSSLNRRASRRPISRIRLYWHGYRYFPYEKRLAKREVQALIKPVKITFRPKYVSVQAKVNPGQLQRLVYFRGYEALTGTNLTLQSRIEDSANGHCPRNRQSTRYSVHGLHDYKGKFNPQVARAILNILAVAPPMTVIDPFCGSGTTLVECSHLGLSAVGLDLNPLAVHISNAKLSALAIPATEARRRFDRVARRAFAIGIPRLASPTSTDTERHEYLLKWFTRDTLALLETLKVVIATEAGACEDIFLLIVSDMLRDYSLQEPTDLRIRRRHSRFPDTPFVDAFCKRASQFVDRLTAAQDVIGKSRVVDRAHLFDSRRISSHPSFAVPKSGFDAAITSPPYATALPYIDTQRLSLVWLGLISPNELGGSEAALTGSREFSRNERGRWSEALDDNALELPRRVHRLCRELAASVGDSDGFRRQAVPSLLYRYFADMGAVFAGMSGILKRSAPFALIIGKNSTTLGGRRFTIDTPSLLGDLATHNGWHVEEITPLETYHRYASHAANSVRAESLLVLRRE